MCVTKNLSLYVYKKGINLSAMSRATGIERGRLHASLSTAVQEDKRRPLRDDELIKVCKFLGVDPMMFDEEGG